MACTWLALVYRLSNLSQQFVDFKEKYLITIPQKVHFSVVILGCYKGYSNVQHSVEPGFEPGTSLLEGRDLSTASTTPP